jgi:PAS domain S-box-containing protein
MEAPLEDSAEEIERLRQRVAELTVANAELRAGLTERTRAEAAVSDGEPSAHQVLDSLPALIVVMTSAGEIEHVNRSVLAYFGGTLAESKKWKINDSVHADDRLHVIDTFRKAISAGQPYDLEHRLRRFDGEYLWFQASGLPLSDAAGRIVRWYVLLTDIEDRKRAENSLRATEGSLRQIIDTLPVTAWSTRPDGYCDFLNRRWLDYAGFTAEQAEGWGWGAVIHPDDSARLVEHWQSRLASGAGVDVEARMRRHDGVYRWFLFRANPLRDESGAIVKWYGSNVDIEDRKRADEALRASELNLRELTETIPEMLWSATAEGAIDYCNSRFLNYTGLSAEVVMGNDWTRTIHPEDAEQANQAWMASVTTGAPYRIEARTLHAADGTYRWCVVSALPLCDEQNGILRWHGTAVDVHDRKLAQEELRQREQDTRLIVDCIPGLVAVLGPGGEVKQVNRRMAEFFGKSAEGLSDWRTSDIVPAAERQRVVDAMAKSLETGQPFEMENRLRRFDGVYGWFQIRGLPLKDPNGRLLRWYFLVVDIEQRRQAEEALRRSQALLAEAQRISSTGSFSWRLDNDELEFSEELCRIFELDENAGVTFDLVRARTHPEDIGLLSQAIEQVRNDGGDFENKRRLRMPDGRIKHIRTFGRVIQQPELGRECIGAVQDVTQRHLADEALDKARSELAHVTRNMTLGALTASIAHEVNQPLSGIVTNAATCVRQLTADPPNVDGARETARRMIRDSNRAADVIARLRALFGKKAVATETVDLNDAAREVITLLSNDLQRRRVVLQTELDDDSPLVTGDRVQIQQVILNLVRNAADAMSCVDDRPRRLLIRTERDKAGYVQLIVQDVGVGLEAASLDRLFDAFYTTKDDSMGIGLSVCRSIIETHHGRLWAVRNDGPGATVGFSIPSRADVAGAPET